MRSFRAIAVIATVLAAPLAGCANPEQEALRAPKDSRADRATALHGVSFAPARADVTPDERQRLAAFVNDLHHLDRTTVVLLTAPESPGLQAHRAANVRRHLHAMGVSTTSVAPAKGVVVGLNTVLVSAESYSARALNCPDWSKIGGIYDPYNGLHSNVGCATASNLSDMVANPRDLAVGRSPIGPASGHLGAAAVDRLYNDKVKAPVSQTTSTAQPGAGGGGGGGGSN